MSKSMMTLTKATGVRRMIVKGYPHKAPSPAVQQVMKGFTDNPLLKPKHKAARQRMSKLRHDFLGNNVPQDSGNQAAEEADNGNN